MIINNFLNLKLVSYVCLFSIFCMDISVNAAVSSQSIQNQDDLSEIRNNFNSSMRKGSLAKIFNRLDSLGRVIGEKAKTTLHRTSNFFKQNKRRLIRSAAYIVLCLLIFVPTCSIIATERRAEDTEEWRQFFFQRLRTNQPEFAPEVYEALGTRRHADPYEILGINHDATRENVIAAHRQRIRNWHPDRNRNALANNVSAALNQSRDAILNPLRPNIIF